MPWANTAISDFYSSSYYLTDYNLDTIVTWQATASMKFQSGYLTYLQ